MSLLSLVWWPGCTIHMGSHMVPNMRVDCSTQAYIVCPSQETFVTKGQNCNVTPGAAAKQHMPLLAP